MNERTDDAPTVQEMRAAFPSGLYRAGDHDGVETRAVRERVPDRESSGR